MTERRFARMTQPRRRSAFLCSSIRATRPQSLSLSSMTAKAAWSVKHSTGPAPLVGSSYSVSPDCTRRISPFPLFQLHCQARASRGVRRGLDQIIELIGVFRQIVELATAIVIAGQLVPRRAHHHRAIDTWRALRREDGPLGITLPSFPTAHQRYAMQRTGLGQREQLAQSR